MKFSKSAACLNPTISNSSRHNCGGVCDETSSNMSDFSVNTTPTTASQAGISLNRMRFSDFTVLSTLGQGSFGKVYHVIPKMTTMVPSQAIPQSYSPLFAKMRPDDASSIDT